MVFDEECACWLHDYNYKGSYTIALAPGEEFKAEYRSAIETAAREGAPRRVRRNRFRPGHFYDPISMDELAGGSSSGPRAA